MRLRFVALLCLAGLASACTGSSPTPEAQGSGSVKFPCIPPARPPSGYVEVTHSEVPQGDVNGIQILFKGPDGEHLVYTSGVPMDLFKRAPVAEGLKLVIGGTAALFQHGKDTWILYWTQNDACYQYTVGGEGLSRAAFLQLMADTGVLQPK